MGDSQAPSIEVHEDETGEAEEGFGEGEGEGRVERSGGVEGEGWVGSEGEEDLEIAGGGGVGLPRGLVRRGAGGGGDARIRHLERLGRLCCRGDCRER